MGDKVCDRACQILECGYDGGDCGLSMMVENDLLGYNLTNNTKEIQVNLIIYLIRFMVTRELATSNFQIILFLFIF